MKHRMMYLFFALFVLILVLFLTSYKLPYYIYQPGNASALEPLVELKDGFDSEGDMHLVTVRGGQATPIYYLLAKIKPYYEINDLDDIRPDGISQEEYNHIQLQSMNSSQDTAIAVAYGAANLPYEYKYNGLYVMHVYEDMPAYEVFEVGDQITSVDSIEVTKTDDLINYLQDKKENDTVEVEIKRNDEKQKVEVTLARFPEKPETIGMGISLVEDRKIVTDPVVKINSGDIGGPSAGLMFSLEIYDRLTETDFTKGYQICGTGTISPDGTVGPIGGIEQKVVASDQDGCDIFFAPNEQGIEDSDYHHAKDTARDLDTDMEIIPVDTFQEALDFLEELKPSSLG